MQTNGLVYDTYKVRKRILKMANACGGSAHIGGSLSMADMLTVLYKRYMRYNVSNPSSSERDYFILSKGHCVLAFYAVLAECGFISEEQLASFQKDGSSLSAHPVMNIELGIESSNGSLGQGISMAVGLAKAFKMRGQSNSVYTLIGNGESNEGSVWEAAMTAAQWKLDNLTVIMDNNGMQSDGLSRNILDAGNEIRRWADLGFDAKEINGNDIGEICSAFDSRIDGKPHIIIGNTVKGCGVSFMENNNEWHHNRLSNKLYENACQELEARYD